MRSPLDLPSGSVLIEERGPALSLPSPGFRTLYLSLREASLLIPGWFLVVGAEAVGEEERKLAVRVASKENNDALCASRSPCLWPVCHC